MSVNRFSVVKFKIKIDLVRAFTKVYQGQTGEYHRQKGSTIQVEYGYVTKRLTGIKLSESLNI